MAGDAPLPRTTSSRGPLHLSSNCNQLSLSRIHCAKDADSSGTPQACLKLVLLWYAQCFVHHGTIMNLTWTMMESMSALYEAMWWSKSRTWTWKIQSVDLYSRLSYDSYVSWLFKLVCLFCSQLSPFYFKVVSSTTSFSFYKPTDPIDPTRLHFSYF